MPDQPAQPARFKADMPRIPGLGGTTPSQSSHAVKLAPRLILLAVLAALAVAGGLAWRHMQRVRANSPSARALADAVPPVAPPFVIPEPAPPAAAGPEKIASLAELNAPWSRKRFVFVRPDSGASVPAMVVRLPGTAGNLSNSYWAFALAEPYGSCNLDYVTDLQTLAGRYNYSASHPMIAAPCDGTLYDPLRMGMTPAGAWVRGEVAAGAGIRPPMSIRVQVKGESLIADQME